MKFIGAHVSIAGGVENAPVNASAIGATAFAMFTKNQRQWKAPALSEANRSAFAANLNDSGILPRHVLPHDGYLINLAQPDEVKRRAAVEAFAKLFDEGGAPVERGNADPSDRDEAFQKYLEDLTARYDRAGKDLMRAVRRHGVPDDVLRDAFGW